MLYKIKTFAKINLSLLVYRPRSKDGYHPICSVFQNISLFDELKIKILKNQPGYFKLSCNHPDVPLNSENILSKIYFKLKKDIPFGLDIHIQKNIPLGGGLGGGSSNAAAFLAFLNQYVPLNYSLKKLQNIGLKFGADIPFFLVGGTALVRGIGEKIRSLKPGTQKYFLVFNPGLHLNTQKIYQAFDAFTENFLYPAKTPKRILQGKIGPNSLQSVVFAQYPLFRDIEQQLQQLGAQVYMTGSGATLFIPFKQLKACRLFQAQLQEIYPDKFMCTVKTVDKSYRSPFIKV